MVTGTIRKTEEYPKQFVMIKNAVGGLTVKTEAFDFSVPARISYLNSIRIETI